MKRPAKTLLTAFAIAVLVGIVIRCLPTEHVTRPPIQSDQAPKRIAAAKRGVVASRHVRQPVKTDEADKDDADEIRLKVWEDFLEPYLEESGTNREITVDEMIRTKELFDSLNEEQRSDEIGHTMNLIPDESIGLLYGILFDPAEGAEITDAIFCDILNRDEDIKMPVMRQLLKMKDHPCYEDVRHILSVVGDEDEEEKTDDNEDKEARVRSCTHLVGRASLGLG